MNMKLSDKGRLEIAEHEGIVPTVYLDSVGVKTYGIGHTKNAGGLNPENMSMAMPSDLDAAIDKALEVFAKDVVTYEKRVNQHIKVPLKQHEFDALVSFDFNTGGIYYYSKTAKRMKNAALVDRINARDPDASEAFFGWLRPPELRKRRTAEKNLFDTGNYDANGDKIPVWKTNGAGKLRGQLKTIKGADLLKRMGRKTAVRPSPNNTEGATGLAALIKAILAIFGGNKR